MRRVAAKLALPAGLALCTLLSAGGAQAKARYMGLPEAVETATAIAIVHTEASAPCEIATEHWTYRQKVFAEPTRVLEGELSSPFELLAAKDFICASVRYEAPADYLVMLRQDGEHLVTVNHGNGALRIEGSQVEWPYGAEDSIALDDAVEQIEALIGEAPESTEEAPPVRSDPQPQPEAREVVEPLPCGFAVSHMERQEKERKMWLVAGAAGAGAGAVLLGFVFGFRRRRSK